MDEMNDVTLAALISLREQLTLKRVVQERLMAFERELTHTNRFFPRASILSWVDAIAPMVLRTLPAGTLLYRARYIPKAEEDAFLAPVYNALGVFIDAKEDDLGHTKFAEAYVQKEIERREHGGELLDVVALMSHLEEFFVKGWWGYSKQESDAAPSDVTGNGRINPAGISYLYASNRRGTAALEARPHISQMVSMAEVVTTEDITLFDLSRNVFDDVELPDEETKAFRKALAQYFSKPNYSGDQAYLVTQYISEYVKGSIEDSTGLHFDGLCFSSSLDRMGTNYVIFDTSENPKYEIIASSLEKMVDMQGTLETYLPLSVSILRSLTDGTF